MKIKLNPHKLATSLVIGFLATSLVHVAFGFLVSGTDIIQSISSVETLKMIAMLITSSYVMGYVIGYAYNTLNK